MTDPMVRRDFLRATSRALLAFPMLSSMPDMARSMRMGIVVHSYASRWNSKTESKKFPGFKQALDLLEHCHAIGAGGIQVQVRDWSIDFSRKVRDRREDFGMFLEGSISLPATADDAVRFEKDIRAAKEAGCSIVRTVCLSGRRYENFHSLAEFGNFAKQSIATLQRVEPIVRRHKVRLAIENHKDWRAPELVEVLKKIDSEWVGVTLDFGNNVALIEDPMEVVQLLAPYTITTHVKDMGVKSYEQGFLLSEVPLGEGILDLKRMFDICREHRPDVHFNLEMITRDPLRIPCLDDAFWETLPSVHAEELARTLQRVRKQSFPGDLPVVSELSPEERLAVEEENIIRSLAYSRDELGMG